MVNDHKWQHAGPSVLVLDPWQEFITGFDGNSTKEISGATKFIDKLIDLYRLTVFIQMHTGKDASEGVRGTSSMAGWRDTQFTLARKSNPITLSIDPRWALKVPAFSLIFRDDTMIDTVLGGPAFTAQETKIRDHIARNGGHCTKRDLANVLGLDKVDSLRKALSRAEERKAIKIDGDVVSLPETDGMSLANKADGTDTPI